MLQRVSPTHLDPGLPKLKGRGTVEVTETQARVLTVREAAGGFSLLPAHLSTSLCSHLFYFAPATLASLMVLQFAKKSLTPGPLYLPFHHLEYSFVYPCFLSPFIPVSAAMSHPQEGLWLPCLKWHAFVLTTLLYFSLLWGRLNISLFMNS